LVNTTIPVESTSVWSNGNFSGGSGQYANLTVGPGEVSANFISAFQALVNVPANNDALTNNITATSLNPPTCNFTYIAPELTGPTGLPQTITFGQNAEAVVILTPTVGGAAYPTGTVTLTDALNGNTTTTTLTGTSDTISIPLIGLSAGTHTFTATYSGDSNYKLATGQTAYSTAGPYVITVNSGSLSATTTSLAVVPGSVPYGSPVTATATVTGISPTGTVQFTVNGATNVTAPLISGTATATITLPFSISPFSITAIYSGDAVNAGSTSTPPAPVTVTAAITTTAVSANPATAPLGHPILLTATVTSVVGTPASALVTFAYSTTVGGTQTMLGSVASTNGAATYFVNNFAVGTYYVTASYAGTGPYSPSTSTAITIAVTPATNIIQLSSNPIALPYIMTNIAGGGAVVPSSGNMLCTGATDKYGDGCQATAIAFTAADDMRGVDADPFGSVYLTDISAQLIRRIAPNGVITNFAGRVTGTACLPTATVGCTPTLVSLSKPRGVSSDAVGNIFIPDYSGNKVYEVKVSTGLMYLVAGNGTAGSTGDGSAAISAEVDQPRSAWGDSLGNIYIAETANNKIRVVDTIGNIHTFAGIGGTSKISSGDGGPATAANFYNPQGVFVDANLNVYIADSAGRIRVVCVTCGSGSPLDALLSILGISPVNGDIYTIAGNGSSGTYTGTYPTFATNVAMAPQKLSMDNSGNLYISDSNGFVWFLDFHTGYLRAIAANATTACTGATDTFGDGCPATQAEFGSNGGNGLGAGTDTQGNLYVSDSTNGLIREVITGLVSPTAAIGSTPTSQSILLHFVPNDGLAFSNSLAFTSTEWSLGSPATTANLDGTTDSLITSEFAPLVPGARSTPLTVNSVLGNKSSLALAGIGRGSGTTVDPATQTTFGANLSVAGLATDNAGNVYVSDVNSKNVLRFATSALKLGSSATSTTLATLTAPGAVAVDPRGFVYAADTSTGLITQIAPTGTVSTLPFTFTTPAGLAVDALNNLYVSDYSAQAVYEINPITGVERMLPLGTLVKPEGLAIDSSGNLLVADPGAPALYRFNPSGTITTVSTSAVAPAAVVTDAAGNLLIADTADILAVPASSNSSAFTVASLVPASLAIDTEGNLYTGSGGSVLELNRTQAYVQFQGAAAPSQPVSLLESGNFALTLTSISQTDTADYGLVATASTDCTLSGALPSGLAIGGVCALTASYTPTTFATTTDTATFNGNIHNTALSTPTLVQLVLTGPAVTPTATIVLNPFSPASPVYGQTVTVSATVAGPSLTPAGTVTFTIDSSTMTATLISGVATVSVPGLGAGTHTVSAAYTSSNGYPPASTPTTILTVIPATATVTLSNLSQTYSGSPITATVTTNPAALAVNVTYNGSSIAPTAVGSYTVVATVNDPNYTGSATGTLTINPAIGAVTLSATTVNFAYIALNTPSTVHTITLTNSQSTPLVINSLTLSGSGEFALAPASTTCPSSGTLAAKASCTIGMIFTPTALGAVSGSLAIIDNASNSPQTVALSGTGLAQTVISATAVNFAYIALDTTSTVHTISLTNNLAVALDISSLALSGSGEFALDPSSTCPASGTVPANSTCKIGLTFAPTALGAVSGTLTISTNAINSPLTVALSGTGLAQTVISGTSANFGNVAIGTTSAAATFTFTNNLAVGLNLSLAFSNSEFALVAGSTTCPSTVPNNSSCKIGFAFTPSATGAQSGTLTITDSANTSPQIITLSGTGVVQTSISATALNFATVLTGATSAVQSVTLTNNLTVALNVSLALSNSEFALATASTTCPSSGTIPANSTCRIGLTFAPTAAGTQSGTLTISTSANNSPLTVALSGSGLIPTVVSATTVSFGYAAVNTTTTVRTITLTNNQSVALNISSLAFSNSEFALDPSTTCPNSGTIPANSTCKIGLTFTPTELGAQSGTLTISTSATNSPLTVTLSGSGLAQTVLSATAVNFAYIAIDTTSTVHTITLTNNLPAGLGITSLALAGSSEFALDPSTTCSGTVAANSTCKIGLTFAPMALGAVTGTLTINTSANNSPLTVTLSGTGLAQSVVSVTAVNFGYATLNTTSNVATITLTNNLAVGLNISSLAFSNSEFALDPSTTCSSPIPANSSCKIGLTFTPTALGAQSGTLTISTGANNSPLTVTLSGSGLQPSSGGGGPVS
jgi:sugar lactone lactonase YvrE